MRGCVIQRVGLRFMALAAVVALAAGHQLAFAVAAADVSGDVDRLARSLELGSSQIAYHLLDLDTRETLGERNAEELMIPASNMKLLTTGAALAILGRDFSFETKLVWDGRRLTVIGSGDPALADPELLRGMGMSIDDLFALWADEVVKAGIREVDELVIDDRVFDDQRFHPTWPLDQANRGYCAEVSGFNFFLNVISFYPRPSTTIGAAPDYRVEPDVSRWVRINNNARTTDKTRTQNALWIERALGGNEFTLHGVIRFPQQAPLNVTLYDPSEVFAKWFAQKLIDRGVSVGGARSADEDEPAASGDAVGSVIRTPLATIVERCNRDSENMYAEALLKRMGREVTGQRGSWANGAAVVRALLSKHLGPALATDAVIADGSGLSRENRLTPRVITAWLDYLRRREDLSDVYMDSLAVAGESGTLSGRFDDIELRSRTLGKSGYIDGVSCLSGYVIAPSGRAVAYAIMVNDIPANVPVRTAKELQEKIVKLLDDYLMSTELAAESQETPKLGG